jgi:hypothetical protein
VSFFLESTLSLFSKRRIGLSSDDLLSTLPPTPPPFSIVTTIPIEIFKLWGRANYDGGEVVSLPLSKIPYPKRHISQGASSYLGKRSESFGQFWYLNLQPERKLKLDFLQQIQHTLTEKVVCAVVYHRRSCHQYTPITLSTTTIHPLARCNINICY